MTDTLISIISIFIGIIGANVFGVIKKRYTLGFTGNTLAGIFGSIFFIKLFGRLGFDPTTIMEAGEVNNLLFVINVVVSLIGGAIGLIFIKIVTNKINRIE